MSTQRLLMIEDDVRLAGMVGEYLSQSGFAVEHAVDGNSGLATLQDKPFDLVVLDLMLPDIDGLEVCRRLRALPGEVARTPVLMLTAKGDPMDRIVGLELGADDYLPKPFEPRELLARIRAVLRRHQPGAAPAHQVLRFGSLEIDRAHRHRERRCRRPDQLPVRPAGHPGRARRPRADARADHGGGARTRIGGV